MKFLLSYVANDHQYYAKSNSADFKNSDMKPTHTFWLRLETKYYFHIIYNCTRMRAHHGGKRSAEYRDQIRNALSSPAGYNFLRCGPTPGTEQDCKHEKEKKTTEYRV